MKDIKIVQINATYDHGSTGGVVKEIKQCCEMNGIECHVIASSVSKEDDRVYKVGNLFSNKLHGLLSRIGGKSGYFSYLTTFNIIKIIKKINPTTIILHNVHSNFLNLNILLKYIADNNIRLIIVLHDCWFYTGGCFHYTDVKCYKWKDSCGKCPKRYVDTPAYLFDSSKSILSDRKKYFSAIKNLTVVGVSDWISKEASINVFKNRHIVTIHNGIDTDYFHPVDSELKTKLNIQNKIVLLVLSSKWNISSNSSARKEILSLLGDNHIMIFIGSKDVLDMRECDINMGYVSSRSRLRELFSLADAFINLSHEDSLSIINLESQSCGTPVLSFKVTGLPETISPAGKSFPLSNIHDLALYISNIKGKSDDTIMECRNFIIQNFNKDINYKLYLDLISTP